MSSDGDLLMMPINGKFLKKYHHDQVNITPLIKTFKSKVCRKSASLFLQARSYNHKPVGTWSYTGCLKEESRLHMR